MWVWGIERDLLGWIHTQTHSQDLSLQLFPCLSLHAHAEQLSTNYFHLLENPGASQQNKLTKTQAKSGIKSVQHLGCLRKILVGPSQDLNQKMTNMFLYHSTSHETCKAYSIARSSANILFQHKIRYFKTETNKETSDIVRASQG